MDDVTEQPTPRQSTSLRPLGLLVVVTVVLAVLTGCPLEFEDLEEPTILDITVSPSTISQTEIGPHNEFDVIEISTANFDDELDPDSVEVFIDHGSNPTVDSNSADVQVQDNVITLTGVTYSWFSNHNQPGDYNIGAYVEAANTTTSARVSNLEIVTVTE